MMENFTDAICAEIKLKSKVSDFKEIGTLYFGGGTPSLLPYNSLKKIVDTLRTCFNLTNLDEQTIECNPEDINRAFCDQIIALGFDRISLGIQSFHDKDLQYMNRSHDAQTALKAIETIQASSISNYSVDLIYGSPTTNNEQWRKNLEIAYTYNIPHISSYALTVEEGTALPIMIKNKKRSAPLESTAGEQFVILREVLISKGYEHYEVSNFALKGHLAIHNTNYWAGYKYIGLGPGAHSFNGQSRSWNISNNIKYINSISNGIIPEETELLTPKDRFNEVVMTALRTSKGLNVNQLKVDFNDLIPDDQQMELELLVKEGKAYWKEDCLILTEKGLLLCDQISSNLFII